VRKDDGMFEGHSWVTVRGVRIGDTAPEGHFQALYEYSPLEEAAGSGGSRAERHALPLSRRRKLQWR
ncbi:MAG: hypothetical protein PVF40_02895, partial [Ectothiorhodospiraceae bacterium]|jgi:hypothetical protein